MTDRQLLDALLREADPVPNPAQPPSRSWTSEVALLEIERRRTSGRTRQAQTKHVQAKSTALRHGVFVAAAAFAAVLLVVGVVAALTSADRDSVGTPTSTIELAPTTSAAPPTTAVPASTTTAAQATTTTLDPESAWEAIPPFVAQGVGRYRTTTFGVPFSFDTGRVLFGSNLEIEDWIGMSYPLGVIVGIEVVIGTDTIEDTVRTFNEVHDLYPDAQMTDPVPATVGGAEGVMFKTTGLPYSLPEDADHAYITPDTHAKARKVLGAGGGEIFIVDVDGQIVVIGYWGYDGDRPQETTIALEAAKASARALIDSIVWKD